MKDWQTDFIINHKYQIKATLGEGWSGIVYKAMLIVPNFGLPINSFVAIKRYRTEIYNSDPNIQERIQRESKIGKTIKHPNIVQIFDLEKLHQEKELFLVMEYCEFGTIENWLCKNWPLSEDLILQYAKYLSEGLNVLHNNGIIHRDIKPQNILISCEGILKLGDFGVIRHKDSVTITDSAQFLGTIRYSSPEYLINDEISEASDIYSLGCVFYELLYGEPILKNVKRFTQLVLDIQQHKFDFPSAEDRFGREFDTIRIKIESLCIKMLSPLPKDRPSLQIVLEVLSSSNEEIDDFTKYRTIKEIEDIITKHRDSFNNDAGSFVWAKYVSHLVLEHMNIEDVTEFLVSPSLDYFLNKEKYFSIASQGLPRSENFHKLQYSEKIRILNVIFEEGDYFYFKHPDTPYVYGSLSSMDKYLNKCLEHETNNEIKEKINDLIKKVGWQESSMF